MQRMAAAAKHALGGGPGAEIDVDPRLLRARREDDARDIAVGDQPHRSAGLPHLRDQAGMARPVEDQGGDLVGGAALGAGERPDVVQGAGVEVHDPGGIARADGDLLHVDVGCGQQRTALGQGHDGDGARHVLRAEGGAFEGIDGDVHLRPSPEPRHSPMNSIGASSRSPSPMTTVPRIGSPASSARIASTAAWSAAFSSPLPRRRAAATAARSVTLASSSARVRGTVCGRGVPVSVIVSCPLPGPVLMPDPGPDHGGAAWTATQPLSTPPSLNIR